jgi:hypothetical protein
MITFGDFFRGISKIKYDQIGFDAMTNVDVHSVPGEARCQFALASESTTPNEACLSIEAPTGDVYFFSKSSGKTWKRAASNGAYTLANTNANGSHVGCGYFNGKIYYATTTKLGHFDLASTWTDTWQTFSNTTSYRPMCEQNLSLFIGNGKDLAAVDSSGNYSASSLDLPSNYSITALAGSGTALLIGTLIGTNVNRCKVFQWDTYSSSWSLEDEVPEIGINCFILSDEIVFAQCGTAGNLYYWTGERLQYFKKIRGITTAYADHLASQLGGRALFANATKVFSIHKSDNDFPYAIVQEYTATTGTIASIIGVGTQLFVSTGANIDSISANYATATIDTPEVQDVNMVEVDYDSIGTGGTIGISTSSEGAAFTAQTAITDTLARKVYFDGGLDSPAFVQARITMTPATTNQIGIKRIRLS